MRTDRLTTLADYLESHVSKMPDLFDMNVFVWTDPDCGTICCAIGWAAQIHEFQEAGLRLAPETLNDRGTYKSHLVVFGDYSGFMAAAHFFETSYDETHALFSPHYYDKHKITVADVVGRIRRLVADGKLEPMKANYMT